MPLTPLIPSFIVYLTNAPYIYSARDIHPPHQQLPPTTHHVEEKRRKMSVTTKATIASFGGKLLKASHAAKSTNCEMNFNLYLPPQAVNKTVAKVPLLIYLSGLTCTADNCSEKGFFQHGASKHGIAVLYPDTSPRAFSLSLLYTGYS